MSPAPTGLPLLAPDLLRRRLPRRLPVLVTCVAMLLASVGVPAASAGGTRARIDQESWVEWQVADALTGARSSPRSVDPGAPEPAVAPLTGWTDLRDFARRWSDGMADRRTMSHNPAFADGYCCWRRAGEVLARLEVGDTLDTSDLTSISSRAVDAWFDSPPHRRAILDGAYDHVGVGVTIDHERGVVWVAVDLRQVADGASPPGSAWYRAGHASPSRPPAGWPCGSDVAPYGADEWPPPTSDLDRRGGDDRVATSLALSAGVAAPSTVVVASSSVPSDALAAAGLAGAAGAPVLLTSGRALDDRVVRRLREWGPDEVLLLGGTSALSRRVATQADRAAPGATVTRIQGRDRFATAAAIAQQVDRRGGDSRRVVLALGSHPQPSRSWADAVTVSGLAASHDHPVLLTAPGSLPRATRDALAALSPSHVIVPGGPSGVSDAVLRQVRATLPDARVQRVAGENRYETSRAVVALDQSLRSGPTQRVHVVDGEDWPDALTAGPAAARGRAVVALVDGSRPTGGGPGLDHLADLATDLGGLDVTLVGGTAAISDRRASAIRSTLRCVS